MPNKKPVVTIAGKQKQDDQHFKVIPSYITKLEACLGYRRQKR